LDYRHPVVEPAIRSANNSRPEAHGLEHFFDLSGNRDGIRTRLGSAIEVCAKLASSDFSVDATTDA
jgi:hypothetical protein